MCPSRYGDSVPMAAEWLGTTVNRLILCTRYLHASARTWKTGSSSLCCGCWLMWSKVNGKCTMVVGVSMPTILCSVCPVNYLGDINHVHYSLLLWWIDKLDEYSRRTNNKLYFITQRKGEIGQTKCWPCNRSKISLPGSTLFNCRTKLQRQVTLNLIQFENS